jgi:bacterioferritin-associated ferredoxin
VIVCLCRVATDRDIADAIQDGAGSVDEVGDRCGAGTGCGSCREFIHGMLQETGAGCNGCEDCPEDRGIVARPLLRRGEVAA